MLIIYARLRMPMKDWHQEKRDYHMLTCGVEAYILKMIKEHWYMIIIPLCCQSSNPIAMKSRKDS